MKLQTCIRTLAGSTLLPLTLLLSQPIVAANSQATADVSSANVIVLKETIITPKDGAKRRDRRG